jgi:polar amino acid transport system substrate-binding protein
MFMRRPTIFIVTCFCTFFAVSDRVSAETLFFGYAGEFCPAVCNEKTDGDRGFVLDLLNEIGANNDFQVKWVNLPMKRLINSIKNGDIDLILRPNTALKRNKLVQSKRPLAMYQIAILKRKQYIFEFKGVESLKDSVWGVVAGQRWPPTFQKYLDDHQNTGKVILIYEENAYQRLVKLVGAGRADVVLGGGNMLDRIRRNSKYSNELVVEHTPYFGPIPLYAGLNPENPRSKMLAKLIDQGLTDLRASGRLSDILSKYGIPIWSEADERR